MPIIIISLLDPPEDRKLPFATLSPITIPIIAHATITMSYLKPILYHPPTQKDMKLTLSSYKQGHNYLKWKTLCTVKISCNTKYTVIVIDRNSKLMYNPNMSKVFSCALFLATNEVLGTLLVKNYVSSSNIQKVDIYVLWDMLDQRKINKDSTLVQ